MTNINNNDYNHPVTAANQVMERANTYAESWHGQQAFWRKRVFQGLFALTLSTVAVVGISKTTVKGEHANLRPWIGFVTHTTLAVLAYTLSDALWFRREGYVGREVTGKTRIEATEDLVQQQGDRKFNPYGPIREQTTVVENNTLEGPPPVPEVEDIGDTVSKSKLPVLIVGSTGSGKTTVLEAILYGIHRNFPKAGVTFFDGKPTADRGLLGIKQRQGSYYSVGPYSEIPDFYEHIDAYGSTLMDSRRGSKSDKSFVIVDELNNAIRKARKYMLEEKSKDASERDKLDYVNALQISNDIVISQGREKNCIGIATTHEATTDALGQGSGMRANNRFIILASVDSLDNIEMILSGRGAQLITNPKTLERLRAQYEHHKDLLLRGFFALTNVGGDWRIIRLPNWTSGFPDYEDTSDEENEVEAPYDGDSKRYAYKTSRTSAASTVILDAEYEPISAHSGVSTNNLEVEEAAEVWEEVVKVRAFLEDTDTIKKRKLYQVLVDSEAAGDSQNETIKKLGLEPSGRGFYKGKSLIDELKKLAAENGWDSSAAA